LVNKYFIIKSKTLPDKFNVGYEKITKREFDLCKGVANKSSIMMGER
jgi:hypothetical protein